jgi:streptomycin 6-kinase
MKSGDKMKRPAIPDNYTYKTTDDFMRWWREQGALKKQAAEERIIQAEHAISLALMVWADDGGAAG